MQGHGCEGSEFVTECQLDLSRRIEHAVSTPAGHTECPAENVAIELPEDVPVERIGEVHLEGNDLTLCDRSSFDNGEIFVDIAWTSETAEEYRHIAKSVTTLSDQIFRIRIDDRRTVKEVIGTIGCERAIVMG